MSTVEQVIEAAPAAQTVAKPQTIKWLGRNVYALADQVVISGANFLTMVLTARALGVEGFGDFTLVFSALLLANIFQSTLITQPHNVIGSGLKGLDYRRYTSAAFIGQISLSMFLAVVATAMFAISWSLGWRVTPILGVMPLAILAWQGQEFVRRVLYTEGRQRDALLVDCVTYGGQMILIAAMWWLASLTGARAMQALAASSACGALVGIWRLRSSLTKNIDRRAFTENWNFGKWLVGAEILGYFASLNMYMYLAAFMLGTAATGELKAAQILFGPTRVLSFFLATILPIRFAKTLAERGEMAVHEQLKSVYRVVIPVMGAYCLLMAIGAKPLLSFVYSDSFAAGATILMLYSATAFLQYMEMVLTAALTAKRLTRYIFAGYVFSASIALSCSWIFVHTFGGKGAVLCMIFTTALVIASFARAYMKSLQTRGFSPIFATPEVT